MIAKGSVQRIIEKVLKSAKARQRWEDCRVMVIDEISMLDPEILELLDSIAKKIKGNNKPFGGIQVRWMTRN
jgi:ATP-dependent DNA helicase PIF1